MSVVGRRTILKLALGGIASCVVTPRPASAAPYRVGVGASADPYGATRRAIDASGEFPVNRMAGRTVVIKPNLVSGLPADTGVTTDPHVVRAIADLALEAGAAEVLIVEGGTRRHAPFAACGYDFFRSYDSHGRVGLVDLDEEPTTLVEVPGGMTFRSIHIPTVVLGPDVVFISVGKLKTHLLAGASLAVKNLFGLPPTAIYAAPGERLPRHELHARGIHQVLVDVNLARPVDYAVIDGIWAMEGAGPVAGARVAMGMVLAGANAVAVDRVCLQAMGMPNARVQHLSYASLKGLGPGPAARIRVTGDSFTPRTFDEGTLPPVVWLPVPVPASFSPRTHGFTIIVASLGSSAEARMDVVKTDDAEPSCTHIRTLQGWSWRGPGRMAVTWNGRDDAGHAVPPGVYSILVQARYWDNGPAAAASGWVTVTA